MISNLLSLKQLEALVWVSDLGSFRKAAHHLGTTQPNISSRIASMEKTLGVTLMQRDAGSVRMTQKGREILALARDVIRGSQAIVEVAERPDLIEDRLRLGVTELVACTWLRAYLRRIKEAYPSLSIELTVDLSRTLDSELGTNALDLALQNTPFTADVAGIVELGEYRYVWVASPRVAEKLPDLPSVEDLLLHSILTPARNTQAFVELSEYARDRGLPISRFFPSNSLASCVQMVMDDLSIGLLPRALVAAELKTGELVAIQADWIPKPLRFAARYRAEHSARFISHAAQIAQEVSDAYQDRMPEG